MQVAPKISSKTKIVASDRVLFEDKSGFSVKPALIFVEDGRIQKTMVLTNTAYKKFVSSNKLNIENCSGWLLTPAFVNAHTHIAMNFFRGVSFSNAKNMMEDIFFKLESRLTHQDVRAFSRMGAFENLSNGVACVWDHYYYGNAIAEAMADVGLSGVVAPTIQDIAGPGKHTWKRSLKETFDISNSVEFQKKGIFAALGPHATDTVSPQLWAEILQMAKKYNLPIHCHLAQSAEEAKRSLKLHRKSPVELLESLDILDWKHNLWAHGIYITKSDLSLLVRKKQTIAFCPFSQVIFQFPAHIQEWEKAKLNWVIGTDCSASNDSMNLQKEMRFVAGLSSVKMTYSTTTQRLQDSLTYKNILAVEQLQKENQLWNKRFESGENLLKKTFSNSENIHPKAKFGKIEQGHFANIIAWDTNHPSFWPGTEVVRTLAYGDTTNAIANLMVAGEWKAKTFGRYQEQLFNTSDYKDASHEARTRLKKLLR